MRKCVIDILAVFYVIFLYGFFNIYKAEKDFSIVAVIFCLNILVWIVTIKLII